MPCRHATFQITIGSWDLKQADRTANYLELELPWPFPIGKPYPDPPNTKVDTRTKSHLKHSAPVKPCCCITQKIATITIINGQSVRWLVSHKLWLTTFFDQRAFKTRGLQTPNKMIIWLSSSTTITMTWSPSCYNNNNNNDITSCYPHRWFSRPPCWRTTSARCCRHCRARAGRKTCRSTGFGIQIGWMGKT